MSRLTVKGLADEPAWRLGVESLLAAFAARALGLGPNRQHARPRS